MRAFAIPTNWSVTELHPCLDGFLVAEAENVTAALLFRGGTVSRYLSVESRNSSKSGFHHAETTFPFPIGQEFCSIRGAIRTQAVPENMEYATSGWCAENLPTRWDIHRPSHK